MALVNIVSTFLERLWYFQSSWTCSKRYCNIFRASSEAGEQAERYISGVRSGFPCVGDLDLFFLNGVLQW